MKLLYQYVNKNLRSICLQIIFTCIMMNKLVESQVFQDLIKSQKIEQLMNSIFYEFTKMRPLKNVQFCSRPRKAKILTAGIH